MMLFEIFNYTFCDFVRCLAVEINTLSCVSFHFFFSFALFSKGIFMVDNIFFIDKSNLVYRNYVFEVKIN